MTIPMTFFYIFFFVVYFVKIKAIKAYFVGKDELIYKEQKQLVIPHELSLGFYGFYIRFYGCFH